MDYNLLQIGLAIVISLTFFHFFGILSTRFKKLPPGPYPLPLIGNLLSLVGTQPHISFANLSKSYGPIMSLKLGQQTTVVITSPALAKQVLQKQDLAFSSRYHPDAIHAQNHHKFSVAWMPVGPRFRNFRQIMSANMFSSNRLDENQHLRSSKIHQLIAYCNKYSQTREAVHVGLAVFRTTLNLISNTIFSKDVITEPFSDESGKDQEFKDLTSNMFIEIGRPNLVDYFPVLRRFDPNGIKSRLASYFEEMFKLFAKLIDERMEKRKSSDGIKYHDMLEVLLNESETNPQVIDRTHIDHLLLDLFAAATDTTTNTIEWAMTEVIKNSSILKKIQEELAQVIGRGNILEEADISRLPYLSCVVKETFRLHPVVPLLLPRKTEQNVEVCGYIVPKGSQVLVNVWAIGRDSNVWKNPLEFKPERFWESRVDVRGRDFELTPFGSGRRICPGLPLAYRIIPVILGSLLNSFDWKFEQGVIPESLDMEEKFGLTLEKEIPLRVIPIPL
ncbi:oxygenase [Lithospermum erythrorhizon]|uniref:Oxygenase n=1 Tax=Lithospermum erythrorhizon TaxID=34254 RepID=A0AAV3RTJ7_LITER